jgi:hypothetical protein
LHPIIPHYSLDLFDLVPQAGSYLRRFSDAILMPFHGVRLDPVNLHTGRP